jgi:hypothetical protein
MLLDGCINALQAVRRAEARSPPHPGAPGRLAVPTRQGLRASLGHLRDHSELLHQAQVVRDIPAFNALVILRCG